MKQFAPMRLEAIWPSVALICSISLTLVDSRNDKDDRQSSPGRDLLAGPDFRVTTRVSVIKPGSLFMVTDEIITEEFYSGKQLRGLIQLHRVDPDDSEQIDLHSVYHYQRGKIIQNPTSNERKCLPVTGEQLTKDLFGKFKSTKNWLKTRAEVPDHVFGLARWLFIIDYHRDSLLQAAEALPVKLHNHQTIMYELPTSVDDEFGLDGKLKIYYAETREHYGGFDLPMRVQFRDKDYGMLLIDYSFVGPLVNDIIEEQDSLYPLDTFALPVGLDCSEKLEPAGKIGWRVAPVEVVSFQAVIFKHNKLGTKQTTVSKRFVAYDSYAGAMRSDAITPSAYSTTIIDLWNKKKYNILFEDAQESKKVAKKQCVVSRIDTHRTFLPFGELVYMGQATIRGMKCFTFEHITDQLPSTLFPLMTYTNLEGNIESIFGRDSNKYTVVYYFAISREEAGRKMTNAAVPSGPLMRLDVYRKQLIEYHIDVYDYVNHLVAAPNGDRQEELFALKDRCTSGQLGPEGYANLALELSYKPASDKPRAPNEVMDLLASEHLRNKATLRALAVGSVGIVTRLSDIETQMKLSSSGSQLSLYVESRLNVPDIFDSEVRQIGWSSYESKATEVKTIEECFQWAAHAQSSPSDPVLFVSCANSCSIDIRVRVQYEKDEKTIKSVTSKIYKPDPKRSSSKSCPAMLIEPNRKEQNKEGLLAALRTSCNWIRSDYDGKILRLLMPHEGLYDVTIDDLIFEVTKVDMGNDKWSLALGYERASDNGDRKPLSKLPANSFSEAIDGLGLTEASGQIQAPKQVDPDDDEPMMNYKMCHSICMAKLTCRSFSICITRRGIECIISEVDFRDRALLEAVEAKLSADKQSQGEGMDSLRIRTITVAIPSKTNTSGDETGGSEKIELKVDFRCKLYKKNALELFSKLSRSSVALKNSFLTPVDSVEECAEICLKNNMAFFEKMAQIKQELFQNNEEELKDEELAKRLRNEYNANLLNWCSTMHFLDTASPDLDEKARAFIEPQRLAKAGLCMNARASGINKGSPAKKDEDSVTSTEPKKGAEKTGPRVRFASFQLLYSSLFDIQYGIRIREDTGDTTLPTNGLNSFIEYSPDPEKCARNCFLQTLSLKCWCKSFDFIQSRVRGVNTKFSRLSVKRYCEYHTMSLADIKLNGMGNLVLNNTSVDGALETVQSWHYDSRESYTLEDAVQSELVLAKSEATILDDIQAYRLQALGIFTILLASVLLSAAIVVLHGENIANRFSITRRDSISDPPRSFLNSLVPTSSSSMKHKRFVAGDQDLSDIPELNPI